MSILGMPELKAAMEAGHLRGEVRISTPRRLASTPIELEADEEVVSRVQLPNMRKGSHKLEAEALLISKRGLLPKLKIGPDDPQVAELARMLVRQAVDR